MDKAAYLDTLRTDAAALLAASRIKTDPPVPDIPSCPGWNMTDLVLHLGGVHRHVARIIREKQREPAPISREDLGWLGLEQPHLRWLMTGQAPRDEPLPHNVLAWFERGAAELERVFRETDADEPVWTWSPDRRVGFWLRTQAIEVAVHRWDAQLAHGIAEPIDAELATDGIEHTFEYMLPARRKRAEAPSGSGEAYHFHRTDGPGEWMVRFHADRVEVTREHGKGDVAVRGTASDLLLWLWGRVPGARIEVFGDAGMLDRYFELVPPR